jgi:AcrR family transcriptional regulator
MSRDEKSQAVTPPRAGRRPGSNVTRQAILDAARSRFSEDGYAAATIRRIAADAGVDASLVMQFYGSKDELFAAAMALPPDTLDRLALAFDGPATTLGERVTYAFLELWETNERTAEPLIAMLRSAIASERAAALLRDFVQARLMEKLGPKLPSGEDAAMRAGFASAMLIGVVVGRAIVKVPVLAGADAQTLVQLVAPAIQKALVGTPTRDNDVSA